MTANLLDLEQEEETNVDEIVIDWEQTVKQSLAYALLLDDETIELLFGGGAGGGKSELGCGFAVVMCLNYMGIRGLIGRESLKSLKESTLLTLFDVCTRWGLREGRDYVYNGQSETITFVQTGSQIYLKELGWLPSDPNYDRLGSTEYTFAFIDEANQIKQKAKNIVRSRLRYKLGINGLTPKMLLTCNPSKGYLYTEFYQPAKKGTLEAGKRFIQALVTDNPYIDPTYISNLKGLDLETQERLLYGNWEYDDDPSALVNTTALNDVFSNIVEGTKPLSKEELDGGAVHHKKYIIADVARGGRDRTVISYWNGYSCKRIAAYSKLALVPRDNMTEEEKKKTVSGKLTEWREFYKVPLSHVLVDEDGMGGGVVDHLGCRGFVAQRKPFNNPKTGKPDNFYNLKSQCGYKLAELINNALIGLENTTPAIRDLIVQEVEQLKAKDHDSDKKRAIISKDEIKEKIGRSPDFLDNLLMRCFFEFAPRPSITWL